jgi:hypothetical protein
MNDLRNLDRTLESSSRAIAALSQALASGYTSPKAEERKEIIELIKTEQRSRDVELREIQRCLSNQISGLIERNDRKSRIISRLENQLGKINTILDDHFKEIK